MNDYLKNADDVDEPICTIVIVCGPDEVEHARHLQQAINNLHLCKLRVHEQIAIYRGQIFEGLDAIHAVGANIVEVAAKLRYMQQVADRATDQFSIIKSRLHEADLPGRLAEQPVFTPSPLHYKPGFKTIPGSRQDKYSRSKR